MVVEYRKDLESNPQTPKSNAGHATNYLNCMTTVSVVDRNINFLLIKGSYCDGRYSNQRANGLWQDNMVISAFSNVQKQYLVVQRQFMPQMVVHGGTKLERQNH